MSAWAVLLWRARGARRELARRARHELLRRVVVRGALLRREPEEISAALARAMYDLELRHGAGDTDVGLFGPRLFRREAHAFLIQVLGEI